MPAKKLDISGGSRMSMDRLVGAIQGERPQDAAAPPLTVARTKTRLVDGLVAGAVGTVALDASTYLDMALRGRPASRTPQQSVARLAGLLRLPLPDDEERRESTLSGAGALLGVVAGVSAGAVLGLLRPVSWRLPTTTLAAFGLAMTVGNGPMLLLRITDPRTWSARDWAADVMPHAAYALAASAVLERRAQSS